MSSRFKTTRIIAPHPASPLLRVECVSPFNVIPTFQHTFLRYTFSTVYVHPSHNKLSSLRLRSSLSWISEWLTGEPFWSVRVSVTWSLSHLLRWCFCFCIDCRANRTRCSKVEKKRTMRIYGLTRGRHIIWIMLNRIVKCDRNFVCRASERPKDESINLSSTSEKEESESSSNRLLWCVRTSKIATLITTSFSESDKNKNVLKITWYFDCAEY